MIAFRDATAARLGFDLIVLTHAEGLAQGLNPIGAKIIPPEPTPDVIFAISARLSCVYEPRLPRGSACPTSTVQGLPRPLPAPRFFALSTAMADISHQKGPEGKDSRKSWLSSS